MVHLFSIVFFIFAVQSAELIQPTTIQVLNGATFTLAVEYCAFTVYAPDSPQIILSLNTRCYCFDTQLNKKSINILHINHQNISTTQLLHPSNNKDYLCSIPGPTIVLKNGITFDIDLYNNLIGASFDIDVSYPYTFRNWPDVTNLHVHGVHVSPEWDNVFDPINPQTFKKLHYEIPTNHYEGVHWYHEHFHGATDLHIQGGMFGAMLIDNDNSNTDDFFIDTLILEFHFVYFYTTQFCDCNQEFGDLEYNYCQSAGFWRSCSLCFEWCANPDNIRDASAFIYDSESILADFDGKVNIPLLNGQSQPIVTIQANQWYRLKMINSNGQYYTQLRWPEECEVWLMSADGVLFQDGARDLWLNPYQSNNIMDPGSRADIAINCAVVGAQYPVRYSRDFMRFDLFSRFEDNLIAFTLNVVSNGDIVMKTMNKNVHNAPGYDIPAYPDYLFDSYNNEANSPYKITNECPCWTYEGGEFDPRCHWQLGRFDTREINGVIWEGPDFPILYVCNGEIYDFIVNSWHPLHLHTNHFQVMHDLPQDDGPQGGVLARAGDFRDVISSDDFDFRIRYQATEFNGGPIVTHCHFLPHEDEGMIVYFQVVECENGRYVHNMTDISKLNPFNYDPRKNKNIGNACKIFG